MSKKILGFAVFLLLAGLAMAGMVACGNTEEAAASPVQVTDQLGRTVTIESPPERIISLSPSNTEIIFAIGLGDKVVGVTDYCDYPPEATEKESVGSFSTPDIEKVVALSPDLIVATSRHEKETIPELERRGFTVLALDPDSIQEVMDAITLVGSVTGHEDAAGQLVSEIRRRTEAVSQSTEGVSSDATPGVFWVVWHDPLRTAGKDTFIDELISKAGGKNLFGDVSGYPTVDLELVLDRNPGVIISNSGHGSSGDSPFLWSTDEPRLEGTDARRNMRVFEVDADLVNRPGPRIVDGLEEMLGLLHPEIDLDETS